MNKKAKQITANRFLSVYQNDFGSSSLFHNNFKLSAYFNVSALHEMSKKFKNT